MGKGDAGNVGLHGDDRAISRSGLERLADICRAGPFWQCAVGIAVTLYLIGLGCWGIIHRGLGLY
jgi:hypothetical protein